jgi:hypothetical protein
MTAESSSLRSGATEPAAAALSHRRVVAVVCGIEDYQVPSGSRGLPKVDYARNDVEDFSATLKMIFPNEQLDLALLEDSDATRSSLDYALLQAIESLQAEDLFVFYYAGHGFHGTGGNRITAWDSHPFNVEGSTLLLREVLFDRLEKSKCERALVFIDACASGFEPLVRGRDVIASMDAKELKAFLTSAAYRAMFLSCKPGQKSYPSAEHKHGVWTYFLLKALRGETEDALGPGRFLTDVSLRDYLKREVPRYLTRHFEEKGNQTPQAIIEASNTFAIRHVPQPTVPVAPAGDLSRIRVKPTEEYLKGVESGPVRSLKTFSKGKHRVFATVTERTNSFVQDLLEPQVNEEIQRLYEAVKSVFRLKRKDVSHEAQGGQGNLDTEFFRFSIETYQSESKPENYVITRRLELREGAEAYMDQIDRVFGRIFEQVVVEMDPDGLDYDELVEFFEGVEEAHGGDLKDEQAEEKITYTAADGTRVRIDLGKGQISLSGGGRHRCSDLLTRAQQYRFTLQGPSRLLLSSG